MSANRTAREESEEAIQSLRFSELEEKHLALEKDRNIWFDKAKAEQTKTSTLEIESNTLNKKIADLRFELSSSKNQLVEEKEKGREISSQSKTQQERTRRIEAEADNLREEISKLTNSKRELQNELSEFETKVKLNDSVAVPLHYEVERVKKELDALSTHSRWLENELSNRNNELSRSRTQHTEELMNIRKEFDDAVLRRDELTADVNRLVTNKSNIEKKLEILSKHLKDMREETAVAAETAEHELQSERKLVELQKQELDRVTSRNDRLNDDLKELRHIASKSAEDVEDEIETVREEVKTEADKVIEAQHASFTEEINQLKKKLQKYNQSHTGSKLSSSKISEHELKYGDKLMGVTDLYSKLNETEDELRKERSERKNLALYIKQIEVEIAAKTPAMQRQRREYEEALQRQEDMRNRLRDSLEEARNGKEETQEVRDELDRILNKNDQLIGENEDLAKQIQALLTSRIGGDVSEGVPTTISEFQKQNQQLLGENRRLSSQVSELQDNLRNDVKIVHAERMVQELETLREERVRHETLVDDVVQQRDLYRALLNKQSGSSDGLTNTDLAVAGHSQNIKMIENRCNIMEEDLLKTRASLTVVEGEKKILSERVERYTTHNDELTFSIGKLQNELTTSNGNAARSEAEASYHSDKCLRMETTLEETREELKRVQELKKDTQNLCSKLQQQITEGNTKASKYENNLRQAEMKLRLAETLVETAKAVEGRLDGDNRQLRTEITRQGALQESVQRIEASLSAKNDEDKEILKEQNSQLKDILNQERSKGELALENARNHINELEMEVKETLRNKEQAMTNLASTKQEVTSFTIEHQNREKNIASLKTELKSLKERVNITSGDAEASLKKKLEILTKEHKDAKLEVLSMKERSTNFEKIAKAREQEITMLLRGSKEFKKEREEEIKKLQKKNLDVKNEGIKKDAVISDFTRDLSAHRDEQKKSEAILNEKITSLEVQVINSEKDTEAAIARSSEILSEVENYKKNAAESQHNYERELRLHSNARSDIHEARKQFLSENHLRKSAEEKLTVGMTEISGKERQVKDEKSKISFDLKKMEDSLKQTRKQNELLHSQLKTLGDQVDKTQLDRIQVSSEESSSTGVSNIQKSVLELREIIRFMRSEREINLAHLDASRRTAEREKAASAVIKRSLDEARTELRVLEESKLTKERSHSSTKMGDKLQAAEEQLILLRESNKLLRGEGMSFQQSIGKLKIALSEQKDSLKTITKSEKDLIVERAALESERKSLHRELEDWKDRVQSLISKFNGVDPKEHEKTLKDVELLKKQCIASKNEKESAETDVANAKAIMTKLNKDLSQQKLMVQKQQSLLKKTNVDRETVSATAATIKERDQLKEKYKKIESEFTSTKTELNGAHERTDRLTKHLRQLKKNNTELRKKITSLEVGSYDSKIEKQVEVKEELKFKDDTASIQSIGAKDNNTNEELPSVPDAGFRFGPSSSKEIGSQDKKNEIFKKEILPKIEPISKKQKILTRKEDVFKKETATQQEQPVKKQKVSEKDGNERNEQGDEEQGKASQILKEKLLKKHREANILKEKLRKRKMDKQSTEENAQKKVAIAETRSTDGSKPEKKSVQEDQGFKDEKNSIKDNNNQVLKVDTESTAEKTTEGIAKLQTFGNNTPFGSGVSFSSATTTFGNTSFGKKSPATSGTIFVSNASSGSFGSTAHSTTGKFGTSSVFLDMKPPSSSAAPFSFGSPSIKLPTPTPGPSSTGASPFGAFHGKTFGSGGTPTPKPLFGTAQSIKLSTHEGTIGEQGGSHAEDSNTEKNELEGHGLEHKQPKNV